MREITTTLPPITASAEHPVTVYYCKAGIPTGQTVRVSSKPAGVIACQGVKLDAVSGDMLNGNATGQAKSSGARCVLRLTSGTIHIIP